MYHLMGNSNDDIGKSICAWYVSQGNKPVFGPFGAVGFLDSDGNLKGAAILLNYNKSNIEVHLYAPKCFTRNSIRAVFNYVFNELKCTRLTAIPERKNKNLIKIMGRLGFVYEYNLVKYYGKEKENDGVIFRMTSIEAKKWIKIDA